MTANIFNRHPAESGETYCTHLRFASGVGFKLILAGLAAIVHAVFPFLCKTTASRLLTRVHDRVTAARTGAKPG